MCNLPFTALYFAVNCFFFWFNTRQHLFKRCNSGMSSISSNLFFIFLQENLLNKTVLKQSKSNLAIRLCHSLEPAVSTRSSQSAVDFLIDRYGEEKITEEYCSECEKKYQSVSSGIHVSDRGCVRYYCDDKTVCDLCQYMETHPDVME